MYVKENKAYIYVNECFKDPQIAFVRKVKEQERWGIKNAIISFDRYAYFKVTKEWKKVDSSKEWVYNVKGSNFWNEVPKECYGEFLF